MMVAICSHHRYLRSATLAHRLSCRWRCGAFFHITRFPIFKPGPTSNPAQVADCSSQDDIHEFWGSLHAVIPPSRRRGPWSPWAFTVWSMAAWPANVTPSRWKSAWRWYNCAKDVIGDRGPL